MARDASQRAHGTGRDTAGRAGPGGAVRRSAEAGYRPAPGIGHNRPPIRVARAFEGLYRPHRTKIFYGGRGGGKSTAIADALVTLAHSRTLRILCVREFQSSMADSVHRLLADRIEHAGLLPWFNITERTITHRLTGSEFIFKGIRLHAAEIKSTEGIDICWFEEAQSASKASLEILRPTIRKAGSELWYSLNPGEATDPIYQMILNPPDDAYVRKVNWDENPWFGETALEAERAYMLRTDPAAYSWVWEGNPRTLTEALVLGGKFDIGDTPLPTKDTRFYYGMDWGYVDPTVCVRCWIYTDQRPEFRGEQDLIIDYEAYEHKVDLDDVPALIRRVPGADAWPIKADCSQPATISYVARKGFNIKPADKWPGSVEDGIAHLRAFRRIRINERCKYTGIEARSYSYKVDAKTQDVLPVLVDKSNHAWDAVRYALDGVIQSRGVDSVWARLAQR